MKSAYAADGREPTLICDWLMDPPPVTRVFAVFTG